MLTHVLKWHALMPHGAPTWLAMLLGLTWKHFFVLYCLESWPCGAPLAALFLLIVHHPKTLYPTREAETNYYATPRLWDCQPCPREGWASRCGLLILMGAGLLADVKAPELFCLVAWVHHGLGCAIVEVLGLNMCVLCVGDCVATSGCTCNCYARGA